MNLQIKMFKTLDQNMKNKNNKVFCVAKRLRTTDLSLKEGFFIGDIPPCHPTLIMENRK